MTCTIDKEAVRAAYENVRDDNTDTMWVTLRFNDNVIEVDSQGVEYDQFLERLTEDQRVFAYVRFVTGDEMSKRAKFAFITWVGSTVSPIKKAKVSVEKIAVKQILQSFAVEILTSERSEVSYNTVRTSLIKAGGASYGTGVSS